MNKFPRQQNSAVSRYKNLMPSQIVEIFLPRQYFKNLDESEVQCFIDKILDFAPGLYEIIENGCNGILCDRDKPFYLELLNKRQVLNANPNLQMSLLSAVSKIENKTPCTPADVQVLSKFKYKRLARGVFDGTNWSGIDLSYADLTGASFAGCNMSNVNFSSAIALRADFSSADLSFANFAGADVKDIIFNGANLTNSNLFPALHASSTFDEGVTTVYDGGSTQMRRAVAEAEALYKAGLIPDDSDPIIDGAGVLEPISDDDLGDDSVGKGSRDDDCLFIGSIVNGSGVEMFADFEEWMNEGDDDEVDDDEVDDDEVGDGRVDDGEVDDGEVDDGRLDDDGVDVGECAGIVRETGRLLTPSDLGIITSGLNPLPYPENTGSNNGNTESEADLGIGAEISASDTNSDESEAGLEIGAEISASDTNSDESEAGLEIDAEIRASDTNSDESEAGLEIGAEIRASAVEGGYLSCADTVIADCEDLQVVDPGHVGVGGRENLGEDGEDLEFIELGGDDDWADLADDAIFVGFDSPYDSASGKPGTREEFDGGSKDEEEAQKVAYYEHKTTEETDETKTAESEEKPVAKSGMETLKTAESEEKPVELDEKTAAPEEKSVELDTVKPAENEEKYSVDSVYLYIDAVKTQADGILAIFGEYENSGTISREFKEAINEFLDLTLYTLTLADLIMEIIENEGK